MVKMRKAFFLDRDGVINKSKVVAGKPFAPTQICDIEILPGVCDALGLLREAGFLNIIVTNQPDISTGRQSLNSLAEIHTYLQQKLPIDDVFICPHIEEHYCQCRKPKPGLLIQAASRWGIDLTGSYMIGDRWRDIEAGQAAGCETSFFIDYKFAEPRPKGSYLEVSSLLSAANKVLSSNHLL